MAIKKVVATQKTVARRRRKMVATKELPGLALAKKFCALVLSLAIIAPQVLTPLTALGATTPLPNRILRSCGLDIVLVLDNSVSIDGDELGEMKTAFNNFVDVLIGTPTEFAVVEFNTNATIKQGFTSDADVAKDAINAVVISGGATNWEDGLVKAKNVLPNRDYEQNLIIFASDGNPTVNNDNYSSPGVTTGNDLENAVIAANDVKQTYNTRIVTLGIGEGVREENLRKISGNEMDDHYNVAQFSDLAQVLQGLAVDMCGGTINVKKVIDDADGDLTTTDDQTPGGAGWMFNIKGEDLNVDAETDEDGFIVSVDTTGKTGPFEVSEKSVKNGYEFITAICSSNLDQVYNLDETNPMTISGISVGNEETITCLFYNQLLPAEPYCGDGVINQETEECDGGENCSADCKIIPSNDEPYCGDGIVNQESEQCDGTAGLGEHQSCNDQCQIVNSPYCGDGIKNQESEECDGTDGIGDHQSCSSQCKIIDYTPVCGNGNPENGEQCDDGNVENGDGCSMNCTIEIAKIPGVCGPAAKVYPYVYEAEYYQEDRCSAGTIGLQMIAFPNPGQTVNWTCYGENGGADISCSASRDLAPEPDPILGCTDQAATNYNPDATEDDGSCAYPQPSNGGSSSGSSSGQYMPGYGPNLGGGIVPQVLGEAIDLDDIARQIEEIRQKIAGIAGQINKGVLGAATEVATGACDADSDNDGDSWFAGGSSSDGSSWFARLRAQFCR